ncbi:jg18915 [Pararge aegeria aegeria]|uniref:Jg18915 protein n=1 Tax=Pararge aegeria aegeria TaxID=348720 RepID=A0A8S4RRQ6_9NEOP|nr:jg18915 [Pararge aegeria aegeria]
MAAHDRIVAGGWVALDPSECLVPCERLPHVRQKSWRNRKAPSVPDGHLSGSKVPVTVLSSAYTGFLQDHLSSDILQQEKCRGENCFLWDTGVYNSIIK